MFRTVAWDFSFLPFSLHIFYSLFHFILLCLFLIAWYKTWRWDVLLRGFYPFSCVCFFPAMSFDVSSTKPNQPTLISSSALFKPDDRWKKSKMVWSCHFRLMDMHIISLSLLPLSLSLSLSTIQSLPFFFFLFADVYLIIPLCFWPFLVYFQERWKWILVPDWCLLNQYSEF